MRIVLTGAVEIIIKIYTMEDLKNDQNIVNVGCVIKINKNLITLKLTLFFLYGATSSLVPYLTMHMQSIGLSMEDIALIYLALPFTTFLAPPVTGFLVDKFGKYKPIVIFSFILNAAIHHTLLLIPPQETPGVVPSGYVMRHPVKGEVEVWWSPCPSRECPEEEELDVVLDTCIDHCLLHAKNQTNQIDRNLTNTSSREFAMEDDDDVNFNFEKYNNNLTDAKKTRKKKGNQSEEVNDTAVLFVLDMHPDLGDPVEQFGMEVEPDEYEIVTDFKQRFNEEMLLKAGVNVTQLEEDDLRCGGIALRTNITDPNRQSGAIEWSGNCILKRCSFREGGPDVCPPDFKEPHEITFWIYFVLRFSGSIMMTVGVTIMDPIALTMIEKYGGDFGREKLFSSLGMALFSPITGALIDMNSKRIGYTDYSAAFYTYDILLGVSSITVLLMPLGTKLPADNIFKDLYNIVRIPRVIIFIFFLFLLGNLWGFIEAFLFFFLKDLGAPNYLLGITVTVGTISSIPFLYGAEKMTKKIGHVNLIIIAFFAHAGRLMGYSFIENPWWCFPFEAMESLSVHLMWVAAATYCTVLAPKNLLATLIGVCGMAHFSIGRGSGSFLGGHLIAKYEIRDAFKIMGYVAFLSGTLYMVIYYAWLRKTEFLDNKIDDADVEIEKINSDTPEPKYKDQSTMVSFERLSLMIEYNQIGSLSSFGRRGSKSSESANHPTRHNSFRRVSYSIDMFRNSRGSSSKVDLLKSAVEVNSRNSSGTLQKYNNSHSKIPNLSENNKTSSAPKLVQKTLSAGESANKTLIPDEKEELLYDTAKTTTKNKHVVNVQENNET